MCLPIPCKPTYSNRKRRDSIANYAVLAKLEPCKTTRTSFERKLTGMMRARWAEN